MRHKLPVLERALDRRFVLLVGAAAFGSACASSTEDRDAGEAGGGDGSQGADGMSDSGGSDVPATIDSGFDAGTANDSGTSSDTGTGFDAGRDAGSADVPVSRDVVTDAGRPDSGVCAHGPTMIGPVTMFRVGTWVRDTALLLIIGHDAGGYFVFTAVCTHRGCTVGAPGATGAITCPCHGARYDGNGAVLAGPATAPLVHYAATVCAGVLYVDRTRTVPATTRTM